MDRRLNRIYWVLAWIVGLTLAACGGARPSPTPQTIPSPDVGPADLAGTWDVTMVGAGGTTVRIVFHLEQEGARLSGTWQNVQVPEPRIVAGTVQGDQLRFEFSFQEQGEERTFAFEGTADEGGLEGTGVVLGEDGKELWTTEWSAVRAEEVPQAGAPQAGATGEGTGELKLADLPPAELQRRFQEELDRLQAEAGFPGAVAAFVLPDGQAFAVATGLADLEAGRAMAPEARMPAGSVGKTFVAAVVLSLAAEGRIDLDAPVETWLGDEGWFGRLPNGPEITVRMLLNHSSGLVDHVYEPDFVAAVRERAQQAAPDADAYFTPEELVAFVLDREPLFPAGQGYNYSDTNYILLGLIVEKVTGETYYQVVQARFLEPLDLASASPADRRTFSGLVPGYLAEDNPLGLPAKAAEDGALVLHPQSEWTGGGLVSNAKDLARWAWLLYRGEALATPYLEEMVGSVSVANPGYGLGVAIGDGSLGLNYGHAGWFPGYRTGMAYYPEYEIAIAIQVNTDVGVDTGRYVTQLARTLLSE